MENQVQTVNQAILNNIKLPLTVIIIIFAVLAAATAVMVVRELKKQKK